MKKPSQRKWKVSAAVLVALAVMIQLVPVDRSNPPVETDVGAPIPVAEILRRACYDCHSHETKWPWYSRLAPLSWWLADHVADGRADLNFSQWPVFDFEAQELYLRDIVKQLEDRKMPLPSYERGHPEARLSDGDRELLLQWARGNS